ncbi:hydantoinase/oxoprolinase family protein [Sphingobium scionense]
MPGIPVSLGHRILSRAPEYDRISTTVVNAYVAPRVNAYLERLVSRLAEAGYARQLMVMQASGGVMTRAYIEAAPIRLLASGPAGGVIASARTGGAKGYRNLLCVDMGGTSYDMSVVRDGAARPRRDGTCITAIWSACRWCRWKRWARAADRSAMSTRAN